MIRSQQAIQQDGLHLPLQQLPPPQLLAVLQSGPINSLQD